MMGNGLRAAYANCMNEAELIASVGRNESTLRQSMRVLPSKYGNGCGSLLSAALGFTEAEADKASLTSVIEHLCWCPLLVEGFRYCPECLNDGYHAIYFQIAGLERCPVHRARLHHHCPSCRQSLPDMRMNFGWFDAPFCCPRCGVLLIDQIDGLHRRFFSDQQSAEYEQAWAGLSQWIFSLNKLNYAFAYLRDWSEALEPASPSSLVLGTLRALNPEPELEVLGLKYSPFEAIGLSDIAPQLRDIALDGTGVIDAYRKVREQIETRYLEGLSLDIIVQAAGDGSWLRLDEAGNRYVPAYAAWRCLLEGRHSISFLGMNCPLSNIQVPHSLLPTNWSRISSQLWGRIFEAAFASICAQLQHYALRGETSIRIATLDPGRYCLFMPEEVYSISERMAGVMLFPKIEM